MNAFWILDFVKGHQVKRDFNDITESLKKTSFISLQKKTAPVLKILLDTAVNGTIFYNKYQGYNSLEDFPVVNKGREVRYNDRFENEGTNVNFVEVKNDGSLQVRTYERGVEDETLACGTGVTAAALTMHKRGVINSCKVEIAAMGGNLRVLFEELASGKYSNIWLQGPAEFVFKGSIDV